MSTLLNSALPVSCIASDPIEDTESSSVRVRRA